MRRLPTLLIAAAFVLPTAVAAQSGSQDIDPSRLGISVDRIARELRQAQFEGTAQSEFRLSFRVDVFGQAPAIDVIQDFDVLNGPVLDSPPSHREMIEQATPLPYRAPAASISNVLSWAATKARERNARAKCEAELAEYRAAIMSGISISAPTCSR